MKATAIPDFVGRETELAALEAAWRGEGSAFIPIYGRRRVGKSELILKFLDRKPGLYFVGKQAPAELQRREFLRLAADAVGEPLLATYPARDWAEALRAVEERWPKGTKFVLALDEFQWTAEASPELPSVLQEAWDLRWRRSGRVQLILCGSYLGFMEREVLGKKSPLFGRRTAQIQLKPFDFKTAAGFHPGWSRADQAQAWFVCGGLPFYLRCFAAGRSIEENIAANFFDEMGPLFREADFLLREELREISTYHAILHTLAAGASANADIARQTAIGDRKLHYYLSTLGELGYVERRYPLTDQPPVARQVRWALEDPLLRFWFRFVFPNTSLIPQLGPARAVRELVRPEWDAYCGRCFERLCRQALPALLAGEGVTAGIKVGEFWSKETQIDLVGRRDDQRIELGECKWGAVRSVAALRDELAAKVAYYPNPRGESVRLHFFTRDPIKPSAAAAGPLVERWHSLASLHGAGR